MEPTDPGYEVKDFGGVLGRALIATRAFKIGSLVLGDEALLVVNRDKDPSKPAPPKVRLAYSISTMRANIFLSVGKAGLGDRRET